MLSFLDLFVAWEVVARHQGVRHTVCSDALLETRRAGLFDVLDCHVVLELPSFLGRGSSTSMKWDFALRLLAAVPSMSLVSRHRLAGRLRGCLVSFIGRLPSMKP